MQTIEEPFPPALLEFIKEISEMIHSGDRCTTIPSDDLLQSETACGGLSLDGSGNFDLVYFVGEDTISKWYLTLSASQIHSIASESTSTLRLLKCDLPRCPNRRTHADVACGYCDYWSSAHVSRPKTEDEDACESVDDWLALFARINPWAYGIDAYEAYNHTPNLECRLGRLPPVIMSQGKLG